jgi:hypothetical protein
VPFAAPAGTVRAHGHDVREARDFLPKGRRNHTHNVVGITHGTEKRRNHTHIVVGTTHGTEKKKTLAFDTRNC